jgi:hypothetical protein
MLDHQEGHMGNSENDRTIDYIELPAVNIEEMKAFYSRVFGWKFQDWGPDYASFEDGRLSGGLRKEESVASGGPLVVVYALDLEQVASEVRAHGGKIVVEIFSFPGGRRFHFADPSENVLAVWSDG